MALLIYFSLEIAIAKKVIATAANPIETRILAYGYELCLKKHPTHNNAIDI
tara:strand:- start:350 stop:502 length:153 start_codon:yes stop_codon:yes gene_type:complete